MKDSLKLGVYQDTTETLNIIADLQDARAEIARLQTRFEAVNNMEAQWGLDEYIPDDKEEAYKMGYGDALVNAAQVLRGDS